MTVNLALLNQNLKLEISLMEQFLELLINEQSVLLSNDIDGLESMLQVKSELLNQLSIVSNNRLSALGEMSFPPQNSSMTLLIEQSSNPSIEQSWQQLINIGTQAEEINRNNSLIVNRLFAQNQNSLVFLQGKDANLIYGPDGHNTTHLTLRTIKG